MRKTSFDQIVDGIDRQLPYLHKEWWAHRYAELLDAIRATTGKAQERAKQAMQDHKEVQFRPETSRAALIAQAKLSYDNARKEAACGAALHKEGIDHGRSTTPTIANVERSRSDI